MVGASATASTTRGPRGLLRETWRYLLVSLASLALDVGLLVGLTELGGQNYLASAAVGFSAGLALNYALSVACVFSERRLQSRWLEFVGFTLVGLVGLGLNEALMKLFVDSAHFNYLMAKVPATGVGFVFNYSVRRALLFSKAAERPRVK